MDTRRWAANCQIRFEAAVLAAIGALGVFVFGDSYLWGARIALDRHDDVTIAAALALLALLDGAVLVWAVYRSPLVRGQSNRLLAWIVLSAWPVNLALIIALYGFPLF